MPTAIREVQDIPDMAAGQMLYDSLSDAEVMLRAGSDDDAAFAYLANKYHRPMIAFMYRMCHNQAVAEELAQEVFLRIYRSRKSYADRKSTRLNSSHLVISYAVFCLKKI